MTGTCPHCGTPMFMEWIAGDIAWLCPRRADGHHPVFVTTTSDGTNDLRRARSTYEGKT